MIPWEGFPNCPEFFRAFIASHTLHPQPSYDTQISSYI